MNSLPSAATMPPLPSVPATARHGAPPAPDRRRLLSEQLLDGNGEIEIVHGDAVYRLRLTALGKLILTK